MNMRIHRQKGASLVEMAFVLLLFLMVIFAVLEFSIAIVRSAQLAEATRGGLRYAIVNDPPSGITLPSCIDSNNLSDDEDCDSGSCPEMIESMANIAPFINTQSDIVVNVKYTCPVSGSLDHDGLYLTTVTVSGAKYNFIVPGILGLGMAMDLQEFKSTRLSEDLHTVVTGG